MSDVETSPDRAAGEAGPGARGQRTAFCIFGQLRDEHLSFPLTAEIARAHGATVFVSVWAKRGTKTHGATAVPQLRRMFGDAVAFSMPWSIQYDFHDAFPRIAALMSDIKGTVTKADIAGYFPDAVVDIEDEELQLGFERSHHGDANSLRMLYRMWRCHRAMRLYEDRHGFRFERVVQFRPDVVPPSALPAAVADTLHIPEGIRRDFVSDVLACGPSEVMTLLAAAFGRAAGNVLHSWNGIHKELHDIVSSNNILVRPIELSRNVQEDFAARTAENRGHLRRTLSDAQYNPQVFSAETWHRIAHILTIAIDAADGAGDGEASLLEVLDPAADATVREAALAALSCISEAKGRPRDALAFEYFRLLSAMEAEGLEQLNHHFFGYVLERFRLLCEGAGIARPADVDPAGFDFSEDRRLGARKAAAVARIAVAMRAGALPRVFHEHVGRIPYASVDGFSDTFWSLYHRPETRAQSYAIAMEMTRLNPLDWRGYDHMGHVEEDAGAIQRALAYAAQALERDRKRWGLWVRLAFLEVKVGNVDRAFDLFLSALRCQEGGPILDWFGKMRPSFREDQVRRFEAAWRRRYGAA